MFIYEVCLFPLLPAGVAVEAANKQIRAEKAFVALTSIKAQIALTLVVLRFSYAPGRVLPV